MADETEAAAAIAAECDAIKAMLIEKNRAYGNSALDPVRVFSRADTAEQIRVRIDDKLSRLQRGTVYGNEDTVLDLIGYLVLLRIAAVAKPKRTLVTLDDRTGAALDRFGAGLGAPRVQVPSRLPSGGTTMEGDREYRERLREGIRKLPLVFPSADVPDGPVEFDDEDDNEFDRGAK